MVFFRHALARVLDSAPVLWMLFAAWLAILFYFSGSESPKDMPSLLPHQDKVIHFVFYAGGGLALAGALGRSFSFGGLRLTLITVLALSLAGALDEYNQQFVPGRQGLDPYDWAADFFGASAGALLLPRVRRLSGPSRN